MIMIDVFLTGAPHGQLTRKHLGTLSITNDTTGTLKSGNYRDEFLDPQGRIIAESEVNDFPREDEDVWELIKETMKNMESVKKLAPRVYCGGKWI